MEKPTYFYHATSPDNERLIKESDRLKPQKHQHSKWKCLVKNCPEYASVPDGVWLSATLEHGALPFFSPYGARRVKIPIKSVIQQLGGKVKLYEGVTVRSNRDETYVRLMLVREDATFEVLQHMKELDVADNPCLKLTGEYRVARPPTLIDVYVPYPIDISNWDNVNTWPDSGTRENNRLERISDTV
ncbi:uncharacterized protein LOC110449330 [Mizuhopecten yessoensis]|uniref:Uncharacterized protein n=1 Tax=Mizuhopecten yessoensis TaxID=6573 RepID=A0A210QRI6_MIZYE|nr:uncharacterized protein LOC110449330 [Mizuhopecten yessoensis]OWF51331.1 hypothetical protein KP79_PYT17879 [Mizuhopecten yessoensis]